MIESADHITYMTREEIDIDKWDNCIINAGNGLIYARSFYLDAMAENWSALVMNDYKSVMRLDGNRKYGIRYLYQPPFTAQLGIFSAGPINQKMISSFIFQSKKLFRFCEMRLNHSNMLQNLPVQANYILDLQATYEQIRGKFKKSLVRNLKSGHPNTMSYCSSTDFQKVVQLYRANYGRRFPHVTSNHYQRFETLCADLSERKMGIIRQVITGISKEILSAGIFFRDEKRIYNIMPVTPPEGRKRLANPYLLNQLIREFSGEKKILDFEGSEIAGIAEFYKKFGSTLEPYPFLKFNRLPFPLRYLKQSV